MVRTASTMLPLGSSAPDFSLPDVETGKKVSLADFQGKKGLLVMFICRHCPYVKHVQEGLADLGRSYEKKNVGIVAISANDADKYPDDAPPSLKEFHQEAGLTFPLLYDETQAVAKSYSAACTPDFFLFDKDFKLVYRGQMDDSRPESTIPVTGKDLRAALDAVLLEQAPSSEQKPSLGCNIKWKPGKEPDYFKGK